MNKLTSAKCDTSSSLMELSPRDQLKASLRRKLAFLKRKSDAATVPPPAPTVVCQKEGGVGVPTLPAVLCPQGPVDVSTGPAVFEHFSVPVPVPFRRSSVDTSDNQLRTEICLCCGPFLPSC